MLELEGKRVRRLGATEAESLSSEFSEENQRNLLESLRILQNMLRQQGTKIRSWMFVLDRTFDPELSNDAKSQITGFLILTNLIII